MWSKTKVQTKVRAPKQWRHRELRVLSIQPCNIQSYWTIGFVRSCESTLSLTPKAGLNYRLFIWQRPYRVIALGQVLCTALVTWGTASVSQVVDNWPRLWCSVQCGQTEMLLVTLMNTTHHLSSALRIYTRPASLLWQGGRTYRTLSSGGTTAPEKYPYITAPHHAVPLLPHMWSFSWGRGRSQLHLTFSSTLYCKVTTGSDTAVRNDIGISQVPFFYLAP